MNNENIDIDIKSINANVEEDVGEAENKPKEHDNSSKANSLENDNDIPNCSPKKLENKSKQDGKHVQAKERNLIPTTDTIRNIIKDSVREEINKAITTHNIKENFDDIANILTEFKQMLCIEDKDGNLFNLITLFSDLRQTLKKQASKIEEQEDIIKRQRIQIDSYAQDVLYKTQKPLIEEIISLRDMIHSVSKGKNKNDVTTLSKCLSTIEMEMVYALKLIGVEELSSGEKAFVEFNEKFQEVVPYTKQPIIKEDEGKFISVTPGYKWNMPATNMDGGNIDRVFVIKHEKVARLSSQTPNQN